MSTIHSPSPTRRGSAMVAATLLVIILASAGVAMITTAVGHNEEQGHRRDEIVLLAAAESAFNAAYDYAQRNSQMCTHSGGHALMRNGNCFAGGAEAFAPVALSQANLLEGGLTATAFNNATISATVTLLNDVDPTKWGDETYHIKAEAVIGDFAKDPQHSRRRFVEAVIRPPVPGTSTLFANAMYAMEGYRFFGSGTTDSYDSSAGAYNSAVHGDQGDIASENWLTVDNLANLNGGTATENLKVDLPLIDYTAPPGATKVSTGGAYANGIAADYTFAGPGTYQCASLDLQNVLLTIPVGGTVTLYVDGPITFFKGRVLFLGDDSSAAQRCRLRIYQQDYVGGATSINGNTNIGELSDGRSSRPRQLQVYSDYSGDISLNGTAQVSMVLFAPKATVSHMNGTFDFLGSILTKSFDGAVNGNFNFVYDTSLGAPDPDDFQLPPVLRIVGWRTSTGPTAANDPTLEP